MLRVRTGDETPYFQTGVAGTHPVRKRYPAPQQDLPNAARLQKKSDDAAPRQRPKTPHTTPTRAKKSSVSRDADTHRTTTSVAYRAFLDRCPCESATGTRCQLDEDRPNRLPPARNECSCTGRRRVLGDVRACRLPSNDALSTSTIAQWKSKERSAAPCRGSTVRAVEGLARKHT